MGLLLLVGVGGAWVAARTRLPLQVAILGLGMLLGSDGPGGVDFDDADLARTVGVVGLVAILFEGGLTSPWRQIRPVLAPAALLSTVGVAVTAGVTAAGAWLLFELDPAEALLLGAVVGSTDAAAVFATLRYTALRRRLTGLLEAESGLNDPMAVALTVGLIATLTAQAATWDDVVVEIVQQLGIGMASGGAAAWLAGRLFARFPLEFAAFAPVASVGTAAVVFGATDVLGGSGFLAVYLVALRIGASRSPVLRSLTAFHGGLAFLSQVVLFGVLGLLVFPSQFGPVIVPGILLALVLALLARPLAVWLCTLRFGFDLRERVLLGWAGLRGAVPIVLATFALSADIEASGTIFNAVFFVVLVSAVAQGPTLEPLARRLRLTAAEPPVDAAPLEVGLIGGAEILEYTSVSGDGTAGRRVRELGLPRAALLAVILRGGDAVPPRGSTRIAAGDRLYVLTRRRDEEAVREVMERWAEPAPAPGDPA
ncbi:MAG TPA: potassium/proton antiporter, partial [Miltoncostaeaceae bacterium]|nr:potassium/proton antiporter [Miltoncostaeaceae bacterium]